MNHHDFANEITAMLDKAEPPMYAECCIYRVPYDIRKLNEDNFTPKVVSIGPLHYGHPRLQNMEKYKLLYVKYFCERVSRSLSLDGLINSVEEIEPGVRRCYSDTIELSSKEFVKDVSITHFTDLIRTFHLQPLHKRPTREVETLQYLQSETELANAGVRFRQSSSPCLMDIKFSGRVLEIPQLIMEALTGTLLHNLVALEQCHYPFDSYIIDYVVVMDFLINTNKDVDVLVHNGVILNWLGDAESVANLINNMEKNVTNIGFNSHYSKLCKNLDRFCKNPWHNMKATLRRDYCNTSWQTTASIAGVLLLVLSLTQTICSILQVLQ
ncbi:hypothetical protein K1719_039042 [Acacia pycnantha]|nr:hypothetical protein K1719_039042 [Acacia pycnantha]